MDDIERLATIIWDQNYMNCSDHCWCNCPDEMAVKLKVEAIVTTFRNIEHYHGEPSQCMGCLWKAGELEILDAGMTSTRVF